MPLKAVCAYFGNDSTETSFSLGPIGLGFGAGMWTS